MPASLAGVLVYLYPAIVAVLSIRYATRLAGRRPWIALGIALVGVVLALGGIDLSTPPPVGGILLVLASPVIYAGWIILSARLAGERSDHLAHETTGEGRTDDAAVHDRADDHRDGGRVRGRGARRPAGRSRRTGSRRRPGRTSPRSGSRSTFLAIQTFYAGSRRIGAAQAALVSTVEPLIIVSLAWRRSSATSWRRSSSSGRR